MELFKVLKKKKCKIALIGIPKTIDNDIAIIDKSFGFETAVEVINLFLKKKESVKALKSGYVESRGAEYGVGLVRIMGRNAGFISMEATNASHDVNICLGNLIIYLC